MTLGAGEVRSVLDRHHIAPSRALGQNFVTDPNTIERIVRLADVNPGDQVVEIGPGVGSLTVGLLEAQAQVVAVELDTHLLPALDDVLSQRAQPDRYEILNADAMELDWAEFFAARTGDWKLVANLPYNVAAPVVLRVLDEASAVTEVLVMVQREVGERLAAQSGSAAYGIPSVKVAYHGTAEVVARVPAAVFHPVPKVESVLVRIQRHPELRWDVDVELLFSLVRAAFGQRRKMLRRSLNSMVSARQFEAAGIDPAARPQDVDIAGWVSLAQAAALPG